MVCSKGDGVLLKKWPVSDYVVMDTSIRQAYDILVNSFRLMTVVDYLTGEGGSFEKFL